MKIFISSLILLLLLSSVAFGINWVGARIIDLDRMLKGDALCVKWKGRVWEVVPVVSGDYLKFKLEGVILK